MFSAQFWVSDYRVLQTAQRPRLWETSRDYIVTQTKGTCRLVVLGPPPAGFKAGGAWSMGIGAMSIPDAPSPTEGLDLSPHGGKRAPCITTHEEMRSPRSHEDKYHIAEPPAASPGSCTT